MRGITNSKITEDRYQEGYTAGKDKGYEEGFAAGKILPGYDLYQFCPSADSSLSDNFTMTNSAGEYVGTCYAKKGSGATWNDYVKAGENGLSMVSSDTPILGRIYKSFSQYRTLVFANQRQTPRLGGNTFIGVWHPQQCLLSFCLCAYFANGASVSTGTNRGIMSISSTENKIEFPLDSDINSSLGNYIFWIEGGSLFYSYSYYQSASAVGAMTAQNWQIYAYENNPLPF